VALVVAKGADHDELLERGAARFEDGTLPVKNLRDWFNTNGIEHFLSKPANPARIAKLLMATR